MNLTALALSTPKFRNAMIRDYLYARYRVVALAQAGSRSCRSNGHDERYVWLWKTKEPGCQDLVGRVTPKTMQLFVDAGLWEYSSPSFPDHSPDHAMAYWWRV